MRKTFAASVAVATFAGSLAATPVSDSVASPQASRLQAAIMSPPHTEQVAGHTTILAVANGCNSVSMTAMAGGSAGCEFAADRDYGEIGRLIGTIDVERRASKRPGPQSAARLFGVSGSIAAGPLSGA